ncbi:MAG: hypothetical protein HMLKMBBP_02513 [Planctomycetes bacterium]|nr:hypothetical protein [Planctomycetota bacterium]
MHRPAAPRPTADRLTVLFLNVHGGAALACMALLALSAATARGDEIVTKGGATFSGKVVREDDTHVTIETEDLGPIKLAKSEIVKRNGAAPAPKDGDGKAEDAKPSDAAASDAKSPAKGDATKPQPKAADPAADAALDAAERLARRRNATIVRSTTPKKTETPAAATPAAAASAAPAPTTSAPTTSAPTTSAPTTPAATAPESAASQPVGGDLLAKESPGTTLIVFEPVRAFEAASGGTLIGRRTVARLDVVGSSSARLTIAGSGAEQTWTVRLADVQRHRVVRGEGDRLNLLEGVDLNDWVRALKSDGSTVAGRFLGVEDGSVKLASPPDAGAEPAAPASASVPLGQIVRVDGIQKSSFVRRTIADTIDRDVIAATMWPDGREIVGTVIENDGKAAAIDTDRDGKADVSLHVDAPVAAVRTLPAAVRQSAAGLAPGAWVRVASVEEYPDARVETEVSGAIAGITPYAVCIAQGDGAIVLPFESVASLKAVPSGGANAPRPIDSSTSGVPVLPGDAAEDAAKASAPGLAAVTDGRTVTHVVVSAPWEPRVFGIRIGAKLEDALSTGDLRYTTTVWPKESGKTGKARELVSESVEGLRVTVLCDRWETVTSIEIGRR